MAWDVVSMAAGDIFRAVNVNQLQSNFQGLADQTSGAPHNRLPFLETASRDAWTLTGSSAAIIFNEDVQQYEGYNPITDEWGTIAGGGGAFTVVWSGHSFTNSEHEGIPITYAGSFQHADASTPSLAEVLGVLSDVVDVNQFKVQQAGSITLSHSRWNDVFSGGIVKGANYWLQGSGFGTYVDSSIVTNGWVDKPVLYAVTSAEALILNFRGVLNGSTIALATTAKTTIAYSDVTSGLYNFIHSLNTKHIVPSAWDYNGEMFLPDFDQTSGSEEDAITIDFGTKSSSEYPIDLTAFSAGGMLYNVSSEEPQPIGTAYVGSGDNVSLSSHVHEASAEDLQDYEEGSWTPSIGGTATYIGRNGYYTKIGNIVTAKFYVEIDSYGTGNGSALAGLPFSSANDSMKNGGMTSAFVGGVTAYWVTPYVEANAAYCSFLYQNALDGTFAGVTALGTGTAMQGTVVYKTS